MSLQIIYSRGDHWSLHQLLAVLMLYVCTTQYTTAVDKGTKDIIFKREETWLFRVHVCFFFYMKMFPERYRSRKSTSKMLNLLCLAAIVILSIADSALTGVGGAFDDITRSK